MKRQQPQHPALYEINTRLLVRRFSLFGKKNALLHVPDAYWNSLADKGMDYIWLMGVWQTRETGFAGCVSHPDDLERYRSVLPDLKEADLLGSPYAIDQYVVDPLFGDPDVLLKLKTKLNRKGLKLILDFVPNHFGKHTRHLAVHPEHFVQGQLENFFKDPESFNSAEEKIFAKAKDPYFPAWQDTVQVNYNRPETRTWMAGRLENIAAQCDGVRCDMAMLPTIEVFQRTWAHLTGPGTWYEEFWTEASRRVKEKHPGFMMLAECYWDMQTALLGMGFDYCYDKTILDQLRASDTKGLRTSIEKTADYLSHSAHFLENHDEDRARSIFALEQHIWSAAFCYTIPGLRFFHDGQWEGARIKIPVQLGRALPDQPCTCPLSIELGAPIEARPACACIALFYERFLHILNSDIFRFGEWSLTAPEKLGVTDQSMQDSLFAWEWKYDREHVLVLINAGEALQKASLEEYCSIHNLLPAGHELLSDMRLNLKTFVAYPRQALILKFEYI